jgi:iron complex transport system ATP-binding protein
VRLTIEDLTVELDSTKIVTSAELVIEEGEFVGLIGPNGSGKSTLLRTIYRVLRPTLGAVRIGGDDVWDLSARASAQRTAVGVQESARSSPSGSSTWCRWAATRTRGSSTATAPPTSASAATRSSAWG